MMNGIMDRSDTPLEVIPSVNCHDGDFECVTRKVCIAETFAAWVHVDVADGTFTFNKSWRDARRWGDLATALKLEVHLMVEEPERHVGPWLEAGAKRIIVHVEALEHSRRDAHAAQAVWNEIASACAAAGAEVMVAVNPETPAEQLAGYFSRTHAFQVLAVMPGPAGQKFLPAVLAKVMWIRHALPTAIIEVDGGIIPETAHLAWASGADIVVAGSYTLNNADPVRAARDLAR